MTSLRRSPITRAEALAATAVRPGRRYPALPLELRATFTRLRAQIIARTKSAVPGSRSASCRHDDV
jgi:hypothetical protein